jgi:hypothetical protein
MIILFKATFDAILHHKITNDEPHNFYWLLEHMSKLVLVNKQIYSESYSSELVSELNSNISNDSSYILEDNNTF